VSKITESLPAVLIIGIDTPIGLTLIRELGERNVPVYGIAHTPISIGLASCYLTKGFLHEGDNDQLITLINDIAEKNDVHFLMTVSEQRILFLQANAHQLVNITALIPDKASMETVLNKDKVCQLARDLGINTPIEYAAANGVLPEDIRFPVILKWANPNDVLALLNTHNIPFLKCEYCYSKPELITALAKYDLIKHYPMIQSYCPGYGLGQMIYMHNGEAVLSFQHKRIHEWPPEGGFSCLAESVDLSEHHLLFQQSIALLKKVQWEGPAMVEYRFNPNTNEAVLMEINGRFWGSLPLAYHAHANFGWTHYSIQVLGKIPDQPKIRFGIRCMFFIPELKRMLVLLFKAKSIQDKSLVFNTFNELGAFFSHYLSGQSFYVFKWRDPKPFLIDMYHLSVGRMFSAN
jgi:predicted ATP-grasp superfamily ATP-dependent carboligase